VNNNPTEDVTVRILWNDLQKEMKKKYSVYNVEKRGSMPSLKASKKIEVITRSDHPASVQFNVTKWFMLYSCLLSVSATCFASESAALQLHARRSMEGSCERRNGNAKRVVDTK
jgi:hypothetical protein